MATRSQKIKVGVFFLISMAVLVIAAMIIGGFTRRPLVYYWVEFDESILGLGKGGPVVYMGVPVGTVEDIYVTDRFSTRVYISVDSEIVTLRQGVRARLALFNLATGTMCVALAGGDPQGEEFKPERDIPTDPSLIEAVSSQVEEILYHISMISKTISASLEGLEEGEVAEVIHIARDLLRDSGEAMGGINETLSDFRLKADESMGEFNQLAGELGILTRETSELVAAAKDSLLGIDMRYTQDKLHDLFDNLDQVAGNLDKAMNVFGEAADSVATQSEHLEYQLRDTLRSLNETFDAVRRFVDYLHDDPAALLRGRGRPE